MIALPVTNFLSFFNWHKDPVEDRCDKLSSWFSATLMLCFACVATSGLVVGNTIQCMIPAHIAGVWQGYINNYCYINHFVYPIDINATTDDGKMETEAIAYYPWVPFFFFFQCLAFLFPLFIWSTYGSRYGIDIKSTISKASEVALMDKKKRAEKVKNLASFIGKDFYDSLNRRKSLSFATSFFPISILIKKWLYVFAACIQFWCLCHFLAGGNKFWGFEALRETMRNVHLTSMFFPLLTWCTFSVYKDNEEDLKTISCVLGMNVIFEKLYILTYFWLLFIILVSMASAIYYSLTVFYPPWRYAFVKKLMKVNPNFRDSTDVKKFTDKYIGGNGFVMLMLIKQNSDLFFTHELVEEMWSAYQKD